MPARSSPELSPFRAAFAPPDEVIAARFLAAGPRNAAVEARIDAQATRLIEAIRSRVGGLGGVEDFLHAYALSTKEGLALMVLAEALLRIPDGATADRLIEDKLKGGDWNQGDRRSGTLLVSASAWALAATARVIAPGETPEGIVDTLVKRLGLPAVRTATRQAMKLLGSHFVLGQTIEAALDRAGEARQFLYSFDMLGEGARTAADAARYFDSYAKAIDAIGQSAGNAALPRRPGISVKLSALHPRYEALSRDRVMAELPPRLLDLARQAKDYDLNFTVDAEEADRLELSLDVIEATLRDPSLAGWDGFGLAIQAYQKRAPQVIDWIAALAECLDRRLMVRLVKGAYWDTEVKRAQERGLTDYPVFTRKAMTDLSYGECARKLLTLRPRIYPQFATHNALTIASVLEDAGDSAGFEFQRLHGMGDALYGALLAEKPQTACRTYAPVGGYADLLAYLVRRLLENGANSSFVSVAADPDVPIADILKRPQAWIADPAHARHSHIPLPRDLFAPERKNSTGVEFGHADSLAALRAEIAAAPAFIDAAPLIDGLAVKGRSRDVLSPIDGRKVGSIVECDEANVTAMMAAASAGFASWNATSVDVRAAALERAADLIEDNRGRLTALLQSEGGKTIDDCMSEVREAADFCRYYAARALNDFAPKTLPGPTGESNQLRHCGRGVFVCISPWNFPLAIFIGQIAAALVAGNSVVAKPAEQTPLIAFETVKLLHGAGVPATALHLAPGDGKVGAWLTGHAAVAGVAFTGSTEVARLINRALAAKDGPIVPLIAETGGINAMIVDATALPEQVTDDVVMSAFRSAGQRCSALRLLCVQDDVADKILTMIEGAVRELRIGDPRDLATHVGPVIDKEAKDKLDRWIDTMASHDALRFRGDAGPAGGTFVAPAMIELERASDLKEEVFGPVLHVVRWRANELDTLLSDIAGNGYGLTLGIHSRIDAMIDRIAARLANGNVYVNRNMIGAVVGSQPFGGNGLSGTGPKAGGPNYLSRFALEQVLTVNIAASGGNATLLAEDE
ncbi:bifunctional proline dehydrogenase/L-glutamate gamma-semialdehyde dehydrogenase PutA [Undibacter mobilis]|uniref:Bifunctional protein PutA n=1 Tax=Undibacter mobilis TaxID=2292256 RepID=A0A371B7Y3_9BRAD|nr:bifunctional proline dehydrogenase/L-glutamate gamma-semialdehyde dehydrogenase PutA [Undibacter mobilis]RDV03709.1 bifunctional proline dehydrogenase/L-glutamate gamma-semialdehyde dehydrogenase PutA [Undibacter mobilis]